MSDDKVRSSGVCKWFCVNKGFGFVKMPNGHLDVFVHANQLRKSGITRSLNENEKVSFVIEHGPKGMFATNITIEIKG